MHVDEEAQIMVPIVAVKEVNGASYLTIYDKQKRKMRDVAIKAGKTTVDAVAIIDGIQAGDRIVVPNQA